MQDLLVVILCFWAKRIPHVSKRSSYPKKILRLFDFFVAEGTTVHSFKPMSAIHPMTVSSPTGPESLPFICPCENQTATLRNITVNWQLAKVNCKQLQYDI
jgi:hypothetical protein